MVDGMSQTKERLDRGTGTGLGPPWHVIVLNDNHNTFDGVAAALATVLPDVSFEQGLATRKLTAEEIFHPSVFEISKI